MFYVGDEFTLYFLSSPSSRHSQNLEAFGQVAATIQEDAHDWRVIRGIQLIQLEGRAKRIGGDEPAWALLRYGRKFPLVANLAAAPAEIVKAMSRIAWQLNHAENEMTLQIRTNPLHFRIKCDILNVLV